MKTCVQEELKLCSYMQTCVQEELQLCSYIIIQSCVQQGTAAVYIHVYTCRLVLKMYTASVPPEHKSAYTYMHSLVLECALEIPKYASAHDRVNL